MKACGSDAQRRAALSQASESEGWAVEAVGGYARRRGLRIEIPGLRGLHGDRQRRRSRDRYGRTACRAWAAVRVRLAVIIRVRMGLMAVALRPVVRVAMILMAAGVLVMPQRHALAGRNRRQPLQRHRKGKDGSNQNPADAFHRSLYYVNE